MLASVFIILAIAATARAIQVNPDTVPELDIEKYLGLWYQMASDEFVIKAFETDAYCCTALYGDNKDGTLSVHNYAAIGGPAGTTYDIDGYAYQSDPDNYPGRLKVKFDAGQDAAPFPAPYWVLELGPVNSNGLYDYAIVSDNLSSFLFVLARDVQTYNAKYKDSVMKSLDEMGFKGVTAPIETYQGKDCVYESAKRVAAMMADRSNSNNNSTIV